MKKVFEVIISKLPPADVKLAEQKWQFLKQVVSKIFINYFVLILLGVSVLFVHNCFQSGGCHLLDFSESC